MLDFVEVPTRDPMVIAQTSEPSLLQSIRADIACVRLRDPAARGEVETLLTYPGVHAIIWHRIAHRLWRAGWFFSARLLSWFCRFITNIDIHPGARIGQRFFVDHGAGVVIGETAEIGHDVTLYHGVTLGGTSWSSGKRHPTLEDNVVVGAGAKILGPIRIGSGTRVGANSVVIEGTSSGATVVGIPAKMVRPKSSRRMVGRIDLDHHLMPDPVGEAIVAVLDRIEFLETRLTDLQRRLHDEERGHDSPATKRGSHNAEEFSGGSR